MKCAILTNHYLPGWRAGGPIQSVKNLTGQLGDQVDFSIITQNVDFEDHTPFDVPINTWIAQDQARVWYGESSFFKWAKTLRKALKESAPDVIYAQSLWSWRSALLPLAMRKFGLISKRVPFLIHPRGELQAGALKQKGMKKRVALKVLQHSGLLKGVYFQATDTTEKADIQALFPKNKVVVAANISAALPKEPVQKANTHPLQLVFCARIAPKKGLDILLKALQQVKEPLALTVIGPKEENPAYNEKLAALEGALPSHIAVTSLGGLPPQELKGHLKQAHGYVLPTHGENFGHSIVEAVAAGCVPLISDTTPWSSVGDDGGWVHPVGDIDALAAQVAAFQKMSFDTYKKRQETSLQFFKEHTLIKGAVTENIALFKTFS